jgi:PPOX class probable FMN-dependent enzyme
MARIEALREEHGGVHPLAATKVKDHLEPYVRKFIERSPFAIMSSSNAAGDCDASPKGGKPGWIKVLDDRTLLVPDVGGNRLFQSYENFESNPKAGLLFLIPGSDITVRVNGRITVEERSQLEARNVAPETLMSDDNTKIVQGMVLQIDEAYFHCPRSLQFAGLWDTDEIQSNASKSLTELIG